MENVKPKKILRLSPSLEIPSSPPGRSRRTCTQLVHAKNYDHFLRTFQVSWTAYQECNFTHCTKKSTFPVHFKRTLRLDGSGAPNGSLPQNICSSCKFLLAGRCGRNNNPWKESVAGKEIFQGVRGDLKSRIAATDYLYGLLTTQDLNCAL